MEENKLHYHMKVRVFRKEGAFGPGVAELMHHVEETGSLSEACRCMGMAYSKGWRIMKHAEEDLGFPLMEGSQGGSRGGRMHTYRERKRIFCIDMKCLWRN